MAEIIRMPKMSDTMEEGVIASWLVNEGDTVKSGDILAEVETDKATMELESYNDGVLLFIGAKAKEAVAVDGVLAIIGSKGENIDTLLKEIASAGDDAKDETPSEAPIGLKVEKDIDTSGIEATLVTMPKMSDTMTEGTIATWLAKVGDTVQSGDILAEVETDKATMELESYEDGILLYIGAEAGQAVAVDDVLAVIGAKGADYKKLLEAHKSKSPGETKSDPGPSAEVELKAEVQTKEPATSQKQAIRMVELKASPLAKKMALDKGYNISHISGSGEQGRIVKRDVENYTPSQQESVDSSSSAAPIQLPSVVGEESFSEVMLSPMRKTIAKRLSESKFTAPHFYLTMEIDMDKAIEARKSINEYSPVKVSFNDMVIKATAAALRQHMAVNSSWLNDRIRYNNHIHIGMAVAVEEGLLVPVVRFADNKSLSHIATETKDLGGKAKNKQLQPADWEGNTFTISNLGMFGIEEFTAIVNPPDACILAVGGIKQVPVVKNGEVVAGNTMKVTLSCDHRVVDGAVGSAFLVTLKGLLEDPVRILI